MHVNIGSLLPKFVSFTALAHSANPDVLAVSESWRRKATKNAEISIPNYNIRASTSKNPPLQKQVSRCCRLL